ncbi:MAG TPA: glycosyl hydrolase, partial [Planctomycetota bacterium]|nr:glycosyl hydrolase [Planctomycetota bacterium]
IVPLLLHLASDPSVDEIGLNPGAIHALWTLHGLGALDGSNEAATAAAVAALRHRSAGVRRNAAQVLPRSSSALAALLASGTLRDADGQVRLEAFLALADMPSDSNAGAAIAESLSDATIGNDRWLLDAVTCAAARHDVSFLATVVQKGALAKAPTALERVAIVAEHYGRAAPVESVELTLRTLATAGGPAAGAVLAGLAKGWPGDRPPRLTDGIEESLEALFEKLEPSDRGRLVSLAARWGSQRLEKHAAEIAAGFLAEVGDEAKEDSARIAAARQLVTFRRDARSVESLLERISVRSSPELVRGFLEAASACDASEAGDKILGAWERLTPATRPAAIRALLSREEWTASLLDALEAGTIQSTELLLDQKQGLAAHPRRRIAQRAQRLLAKGEGLPDPDRQKVLDELLPSAKSHGDAALGKEVYKKICSKCHVHGDEGTRIGPDLTGMAVHPKEELLTNIIDPSRSVEGNYRVYTVVTKDGRVMTGLLASETRTSVELFDSEGKKETVQRADIDQLVAGTKSLMPEGFEKQISKEELVNLLEFLAQRGKYLPIPIAKAATVSSNRGMFFSEDARAERLVFPDWTPKTFEGVPFVLVDPQDGRVPNAILLYGPNGNIPPRMPKSVRLPCNSPAKAIHMLSGVSGWGYPASEKGTVSLIVRLHFEDGSTEDHALKNGEEFADYIRRVDVPGSKFAFALRGQQIRYLAVVPTGKGTVKDLELVKGPDSTAPVVMAVTVETGS